jgi:hypothetical protein
MTSEKNKLIEVTEREIADLYLKKTNKIRGVVVTPVDNKDSYKEFCEKVIKKTPKQLRAYWAAEIYKGNKLPPRKLSSSEIKSAIKKNLKIISYASSKLTGKIILTVK